MAKPYLAELKTIIERLAISPPHKVWCKHFFSGAAAYIDNKKIFMSLTPVGLALKLPEVDRNHLFELGGEPLKYFPKAPIKKDYVVLPDHIAGDDLALVGWITRSIDFARR